MVSFGHARSSARGLLVSLSRLLRDSSGWVLSRSPGVCAAAAPFKTRPIPRTSGIAFILITLAFAQMGYFCREPQTYGR